MRYSNLQGHRTTGLWSSLSFCTVLVAIVATLLLGAMTASAATGPEIAVFTGDTSNAAAARMNGAEFIFPTTAMGYSSIAIFTIKNVGDSTLSGLALSQTGANFSDYPLSALTATDLAPNATATFSVNFEPFADELRTVSVWIASNDADENPFRIRLSGTGTPLQITQQPVDTSVCVGNTAHFTAFGGPVARYQWQRRPPGGSTFEDVSGATSSNLVTAPATAAHHGTAYRCRVSKGSTIFFSSEALLSVNLVATPTAVYDFDNTNLAGATIYGDATVTNGALELTRFDHDSTGAFLTPDLAQARSVRAFVANFKVRMISGDDYADGFSFNWATNLPQGTYLEAEAGEGSGLSICFDTFEGSEEDRSSLIVAKWGGTTLATFTTNLTFLPGTSNDFAEVTIRLHKEGLVDVSYRCTPIFTRLPLPDYTPLFNSRFGLGARTGGFYETHTFDDLAIEVDAVGAIVDASAPGDPITGTSTNSPPSQQPAKAIDNNVTTKYLNFDKLNTGLIITPLGKGPVHALTLISAEDAPERDPSSFVLEGSNDGTNYTRIASNAVPAFPARHSIQSFAVANTNVFNHYRLLFPTVANAGTANSMQIAEVELLSHEEITSSLDGAMILTLPPGAQVVRDVQHLFDRNLGPDRKLEVQFMSNGETVVNLTLAAGARVLQGFELIGAADDFTYPGRRPSYVTVAGSTDDSIYTDLATVVPKAPSFNLQIQEFVTPSNSAAFAHYRITFGPPVDGNTLQVGEMRLFGAAPPPSLSIRASSTNVLVSWPHASGFTLETKAELPGPNWTSVANPPVLSNGVNTVTLPINETTGFFRLRK
jgi:hypothetical protein